jgi:hypothetical protein
MPKVIEHECEDKDTCTICNTQNCLDVIENAQKLLAECNCWVCQKVKDDIIPKYNEGLLNHMSIIKDIDDKEMLKELSLTLNFTSVFISDAIVQLLEIAQTAHDSYDFIRQQTCIDITNKVCNKLSPDQTEALELKLQEIIKNKMN